MRRWRQTAAATVSGGAALLCVAASCEKRFDGPYPCLSGWADCNGSESCDTNIASDPLDCGMCGAMCPLGAVCADMACGAGATTVVDFAEGGALTQSLFANSSALFWIAAPSGTPGLFTYPFAGASQPTAIDLASQLQSAGAAGFCTGGGQSNQIAVDETYVYVPAQGTSTSGPPAVLIVKIPLAGGAATSITVPAPSSGTQINCPQQILVDATNVYGVFGVFSTMGGGTQTNELLAIPKVGGSSRTVYTNANVPTLLLAGGHFVYSSNNQVGPQTISLLPTAGGSPTMLSTATNTESSPGYSVMTADASSVYTASSGCNNNNSNNNCGGTSAVQGALHKYPMDGSLGTTLGGFTGQVEAMTVDASNVYVLTDTSLWKIPVTGGDATLVAGNLLNGAMGYQCYGCGGGGGNSPSQGLAVVVGPADAYILETPISGLNGSVDAVLSVPK